MGLLRYGGDGVMGGLWGYGVMGCFFDLGGEVFSSGAFFLFLGLNQPQTPRGDPPEELGRFKAFFDFWPGSSGGSSWGGFLGKPSLN